LLAPSSALNRVRCDERREVGYEACPAHSDPAGAGWLLRGSRRGAEPKSVTPIYVFHVVIKQGKTPTVPLPPSTSALTVVVEVSQHSAADFKAIEKAVFKSGILFSTMGVNIAWDRLDITVPNESLWLRCENLLGRTPTSPSAQCPRSRSP
jgi:hypothetical protein